MVLDEFAVAVRGLAADIRPDSLGPVSQVLADGNTSLAGIGQRPVAMALAQPLESLPTLSLRLGRNFPHVRPPVRSMANHKPANPEPLPLYVAERALAIGALAPAALRVTHVAPPLLGWPGPGSGPSAAQNPGSASPRARQRS